MALWPNRYSLHRFPYESFETPNEHENLIRFPGKDFVGLEFKADSLNLLRSSPRKDLKYILRIDRILVKKFFFLDLQFLIFLLLWSERKGRRPQAEFAGMILPQPIALNPRWQALPISPRPTPPGLVPVNLDKFMNENEK